MTLPCTDFRLIENIIQKDRTALETLYSRYGSLLYRAAFVSTGSTEKAEAAVTDLFMEIWTFPHAFLVHEDVRFSSWLLKRFLDKCQRDDKKVPLLMRAQCHVN